MLAAARLMQRGSLNPWLTNEPHMLSPYTWRSCIQNLPNHHPELHEPTIDPAGRPSSDFPLSEASGWDEVHTCSVHTDTFDYYFLAFVQLLGARVSTLVSATECRTLAYRNMICSLAVGWLRSQSEPVMDRKPYQGYFLVFPGSSPLIDHLPVSCRCKRTQIQRRACQESPSH